ncbi:WbqC family protein [Roseicyclus sp.]|uniref:WbqC family protein n=1 Tax=Roseicyclus sp. TaxID=1914329 RepID=UPI003FA08A07
MTRTAAIMQPTFLPWLGYVALMAEVDDFVFLDDVQFSKQSWQSRNRILGPNGPVLVSLPVARKPEKPLIAEVRIAERADITGLIKRVEGCLGREPFWPMARRLLADALERAEAGLAEVNIAFIRGLADLAGFAPAFHRSSALGIPPEDKSRRLLSICRALGARRYLSPVGSADYLREGNPFSEEDVRLRFQTFTTLPYPQGASGFVSHMSALDALARIGPDALASLVREGTGVPRRLEELEAPPK